MSVAPAYNSKLIIQNSKLRKEAHDPPYRAPAAARVRANRLADRAGLPIGPALPALLRMGRAHRGRGAGVCADVPRLAGGGAASPVPTGDYAAAGGPADRQCGHPAARGRGTSGRAGLRI